MTETVRQRQFIVALKGDDENTLVTENIYTCMAFAGIDEDKGVVFLCHLNTFNCARGLPQLVDELRKHVNDLSGFKLYTVAGLHPFVGWAFLAAAPVLAVLPPHRLLAAAVALFIGCMLSATRLAFGLQLRRLGIFPQPRNARWPLVGLFGIFSSGVTVSAATSSISEVRTYVARKPKAQNYVPKGNGWNMTNGRKTP